jgi:hypothetical protein
LTAFPKLKETGMPTYYIFKGTAHSALIVTADRTGANLPKRPLGSWVLLKESDFTYGSKGTIGASHDEVIDAVTRVGYYEC